MIQRWLCVMGWTVVLVTPTVAQEKPPTSGERTAAEIASGAAGGYLGIIGGMVVVLGVTDGIMDIGVLEDKGVRTAGQNIGGVALILACLVGHVGGSAWGVSLVGDTNTTEGTFRGALKGATVGELVGFLSSGLLVFVAEGIPGRWARKVAVPLSTTVALLGPAVGGMVGYNGSRRFKAAPIGLQVSF